MKFIAIFSIQTFLASCSNPDFSDATIKKKALKITEVLDSNRIQIFHRWNYGIRGNNEIWRRVIGDSTIYTCHYRKIKDTSSLTIYQPYNFVIDFPCSLSLDTSKFWQFNFDMFGGKIFRIRFVDNHGQDHITDTSVLATKIFFERNPFDTLIQLSDLKEKFGVYGISYQSDLGEFVEFWLSSQHKLTYLPDSLRLKPQYAKYWLECKLP